MAKIKSTLKNKSGQNKKKKSAVAKRRHIAEVAANLFFKKGFMQTTTKELAEACGMSVGTLYYYIKSKNDFPQMFCEIHNSDLDIIEKEIHGEMATNTIENTLRKAVAEYLFWINRRNKLIMFWYDTVRYLSQDQLRAITHAEFRAIGYFEEILEKGKKEGCFNFRDLRITAYSIELLCHEWILKAPFLRGLYTLEDYSDLCQDMAVALARGTDKS
ncbi:MAG: TetR/AcrR family transcriptional regulator [Dehalococcoidia bacterium]|jgi:TetR/AcrR family transcriptional regulator, cholesterol catabolism regulator